MKSYLAICCCIICLFVRLSGQDVSLIKSIYFGGGSYYIDGQQASELKTWLNSFPNIKNYQITVSSHTDNIGSVEYNQWLSRMRSSSTINQLLSNDIQQEQIIIDNNGELNPLFNNQTNEGRLKNRRVDVILTPLFL